MKKTELALAGAVAAILSGPLLAQSTTDETYADITRSQSSRYRLQASDLIGMDVENRDGDNIGEVDDLVVDQNESVLAVVSVGGFLGTGDKLVSIPYAELKLSSDRDHIAYDASEEQLKSLPEFAYLEGEQRWRDMIDERSALNERVLTRSSKRSATRPMRYRPGLTPMRAQPTKLRRSKASGWV